MTYTTMTSRKFLENPGVDPEIGDIYEYYIPRLLGSAIYGVPLGQVSQDASRYVVLSPWYQTTRRADVGIYNVAMGWKVYNFDYGFTRKTFIEGRKIGHAKLIAILYGDKDESQKS